MVQVERPRRISADSGLTYSLSIARQLNGWVVEQGKAVEVATPANAAVAEVVRSFPVGELRSDPSNLGLILDRLG